MQSARFSVGELVHHKLFDYRGVVVDVDPEFQGTEEWYEQMAKSMPPRDRPWYHVLVNDSSMVTYAAQSNLFSGMDNVDISHPYINHFFEKNSEGVYIRNDKPWPREY